MLATEEKQILAFEQDMIGYRDNPVGFLVNVLGLPEEYVWAKMREICDSVRDHQVTLVRACHSVSKTYTSGRIVPWFKTCFQPSTVITSAPSDNQVRNQLWREIHAAYAGSRMPLGGNLTTLMWDVKPSMEVLNALPPESREQWMKNFAIGFSTSPDAATEHCTKMQGWHNEWLLVLLDEACGIMPQIWRTVMEGLIIDDHCRLLAIGNPTDPESEFAHACYSSDPEKQEGREAYTSDMGFHVITISVYDTPNYQQDRRVIPGLAGREYAERIIAKYGEDGDGTRIRVKGLFPKMKEGTYYGRQVAAAREEGRIADYPWDNSAKVYTFSDFGDMYTATIFVQFIRDKIRIIDDYWDNEGLGLPSWCKMCQSKPYVYGGHYCGPEMAYGTAGRFQTGKATADIAAELGFNLVPIMKHAFDDGIQAGRSIWNLITVNETQCHTYVNAMKGYGKEKNQRLSTDEETVYHDQPTKTWHRHMADAHRHLAVQYRYASFKGEVFGKFRQDQPPRPAGQSSYSNKGILTRGLARTKQSA